MRSKRFITAVAAAPKETSKETGDDVGFFDEVLGDGTVFWCFLSRSRRRRRPSAWRAEAFDCSYSNMFFSSFAPFVFPDRWLPSFLTIETKTIKKKNQ